MTTVARERKDDPRCELEQWLIILLFKIIIESHVYWVLAMSYALHGLTITISILFLRKQNLNYLPKVAQVVSGKVTILSSEEDAGERMWG